MSHRSLAVRIGLPLLSWGLPFHVAAMAVLFGLLGVPATGVRAIAAWKEATVVLILASLLLRSAFGRGPGISLNWSDLFVTGLLALSVAFAVAGEPWFQLGNPIEATMLGFRDVAFFLLLYYVGRLTPEIGTDPRTLKRLYAVALVTAAIGIVEWVLISPEQLIVLGVSSYFQDFLGLSAFTTGNEYGLPHSYWTRIGGREVQRAGSVFLSGQGMAVPFLLLLPAATAWVVAQRPRPSRRMLIGYGAIWLGFLLSITRMTTIACVIEMLAFILLIRQPIWTVGMLGIGIGVFVAGMFAIPGLVGFVWDTLTWQTGSSQTHLADWTRGYQAFFERPLGSGLGTSDLAAVRAGLEPLAIDNQYLKYAVELGLPGLILHMLIFVAFVVAAGRVLRASAHTFERALALVVIVTTIGILVNAVTTSVFNALTVSYLYFWFAGATVSIAGRVAAANSLAVRTLAPAAT